ncbi:MAG: metal ABC transporter permease, partial [Akkermansiaceae bacterium]|nr:metal ABC transporter permease [Akkermansiaceae bacterium]
ALSHATLPGIGLAFLVMVALGGEGKALPGLLAGATATGLAGVLVVLAIRNTTRLRDDAAMGIVLSVFFGIG